MLTALTYRLRLRVALLAISFGFTVAAPSAVIADEHDHSQHSRHHGHHHAGHSDHNLAPAGVMGDHVMDEGEWMTSYRYMFMQMEGNRDGTDDLSAAEVRAQGFMVAPLEMTMEMHMFGAMYGLTDDLTIIAMAPWVRKEMDHETGGLVRFVTEAEGLGDVKVSGAYALINRPGEKRLLVNVGLGLPTGSIDERDATPANPNAKLPYPMQLGSGTFDPMLGVTYVTESLDSWSFGGQATTTQRFGRNDQGYTLGNEYHLTGWASHWVGDYVQLSMRLKGQYWEDIEGADDELNVGMIPTARADLRSGVRLDALMGVNWFPFGSEPNMPYFTLEGGLPVYQDLDGPQLETDYLFTLGAVITF